MTLRKTATRPAAASASASSSTSAGVAVKKARAGLSRLSDLRWAPYSAAFLLFALVDLLVLLFVPPPPSGRDASYWLMVLLPPVSSAVIVSFTLPALLNLFDRQQERIERQRRQIASLHVMDTAIASEQDLDRLLAVAAKESTLALDADRGGVLLLGSDAADGAPAETVAYFNVEEGEEQNQFYDLLRRGSSNGGADDAARLAIARVPVERGGQLLGYLALVRSREVQPDFSAGDFALLKDLCGTVVVAVKNARALERARQSAAAEKVASVLQAGLLPPVPPRAGPYRLSKRYEAQSNEAQVGGDIYDFFTLEPDCRWGVMIADVSGKGLAAARKTAMVKYALRAFAREHASPARVLSRLNDVLCDEDEMRAGFVTLVYGVLDADGTFIYASAGHETPFVCRSGAAVSIKVLPPTGLVLGAVPSQDYEENRVRLEPGDGLFLYTDGLSEARPENSDAFLDVEGLARIVGDCCREASGADTRAEPGDPDAVVNAIFARVSEYANGRQADDVAMLWIRRATDVANAPLSQNTRL